MATHVERSIVVEVPVRTAYDQWTQFEDFPRFMGGVERVVQVGDDRTHWVAEIFGVRREWDAAILEQVPDTRVAWAATTGATNAGAVHFEALGADRTQIRLVLDHEPEGLVEKIGDVLDVVQRQAAADLERFKRFIEARGAATGGWRGTIDEGGAGAAPVGVATASDPDAGTAGPTAGAAGASAAGVAGFGTNTGLSSDDPASGVVTGNPDPASRGSAASAAGGAGTAGPTANAAADSSTGVAGFGTNTGMSSDDPASGVVTGDPDPASGASGGTGAGTAGPTADAAGEPETGVVGFGTNTGMSSDDPASGVVTGDPGAGTGSRAGARGGDDPDTSLLSGYPGDRVAHSGSGGEEPGDRAPGVLTGFEDARGRPSVDAPGDDPVASVLTGYPGDREPHTATGSQDADEQTAGIVTGFPGERTRSHTDPESERLDPDARTDRTD